jgi:hypothetical protein
MTNGLLYIFSALFLGFVVAFIFSLLESDEPKEIAKATLRRSLQLYGLLVGLGVIIFILDVI